MCAGTRLCVCVCVCACARVQAHDHAPKHNAPLCGAHVYLCDHGHVPANMHCQEVYTHTCTRACACTRVCVCMPRSGEGLERYSTRACIHRMRMHVCKQKHFKAHMQALVQAIAFQ